MAKKSVKTKSQRLETPTDLSDNAMPELAEALNGLVADSFALYLKTKNFHWHVSGPHFRDYHLLFDEQADADLRLDRRSGGTGAQDRRPDDPFHRRNRQAPDASRTMTRTSSRLPTCCAS